MMKNFKIILSICLVLALTSFTAFAQDTFQKGKIQISKKKSIDAYISIDYRYPQRFQNSITYVTAKDYEKAMQKGKLKNKKKEKMKLKDFKGFSLDNGQHFKVVKYVDLTKKGMGMLPKRMCLEQIAVGKILAFKMYSRTTGKISHELANVVFESRKNGDEILIDYIQNNFQLLVQKDTKNPKNIMHINLLNYIGDDERVKTNYENNHYGFRNQFTERQKFGIIVNKNYEASFLKMLNDYNGKGTEAVGN